MKKAVFELREAGRAHKWGHFLYEVLCDGVVMAKISATPDDAIKMLDGLRK